MHKIIFTLKVLSIFFLSCTKQNSETDLPPDTNNEISKGIFGLRNGPQLSALGAEYTRILVRDYDIAAIYAEADEGIPLENTEGYRQIKSIHDNGVKIILTFRWPDQTSSDPLLYDRVPYGQDKEDALNLLRRFLADFGSMIDIYSVQNEVGGLGPGTYATADMVNAGNGSPAYLWWKDIVETVNHEKSNNPALTYLKIAAPVPVLLKRMVFEPAGLPQTNIDFFYETIQFGNNYCDYVDFHFNTFSLEEHQPALDFIAPLVHKPMIATEWSEVNSANVYVKKPVSDALLTYAKSRNYIIPGTIPTNDELIEYMYDHPVSLEIWEFMVAESDYHEGFMQQSSALLANAGFEILCWNSGWQEFRTAYDLRSFFATLTVEGAANEITVFTNAFREWE